MDDPAASDAPSSSGPSDPGDEPGADRARGNGLLICVIAGILVAELPFVLIRHSIESSHGPVSALAALGLWAGVSVVVVPVVAVLWRWAFGRSWGGQDEE